MDRSSSGTPVARLIVLVAALVSGPLAQAEPLSFANADAGRGQADSRVCQPCHNFEKGAGSKIGPPLYGVVGRPIASVPGYTYSAALKKKNGVWTFEALDEFIANPRAYAPGTKMGYFGEKDAGRRADILAYLNTLSDHPQPLP